MLFTLAPVLLATYLTSTLVLGYHHNGYDVIFGTLIGIVTAVLGYRMVFMSVHDARWNAVPSRRWEAADKEERRGQVDVEEGRRGSGLTAVDSARVHA